jgi:hypothetical protein
VKPFASANSLKVSDARGSIGVPPLDFDGDDDGVADRDDDDTDDSRDCIAG